MRKILCIAMIWVLAFSLVGCGDDGMGDLDLRGAADKTLELLKAEDYANLAHLVHPEKGVRFSPYAFVDEAADIVFDQDQIKAIAEDTEVYTWGAYDGTGDPIELTFADYYAKFIMTHDFLTADRIAENEVLSWGTTTINIKEVYPEAEFVEYNFEGFEAEYEGIDWESLRLVFEQVDGRWYLVGIIHDQWTV